jgi:hypothetical protein
LLTSPFPAFCYQTESTVDYSDHGVVDRLRHRVNLNGMIFVLIKLLRNPITIIAEALCGVALHPDQDQQLFEKPFVGGEPNR